MVGVQVYEKTWKPNPAVWTLIVLVIGLSLGIVAALAPRPRGPGPGLRPFEALDDVDAILSMIAMTFLVALLIVYSRTYADTEIGRA